jgi:hypothetical protein
MKQYETTRVAIQHCSQGGHVRHSSALHAVWSPFLFLLPRRPCSCLLSQYEPVGMNALIKHSQIIDAIVALATTLVFEAAVCSLRHPGQLHAGGRFRRRLLPCVGGLLGACGVAFISLFFVFRNQANKKYAFAMLASCQGTAVLSIWTFEVRQVLPDLTTANVSQGCRHPVRNHARMAQTLRLDSFPLRPTESRFRGRTCDTRGLGDWGNFGPSHPSTRMGMGSPRSVTHAYCRYGDLCSPGQWEGDASTRTAFPVGWCG